MRRLSASPASSSSSTASSVTNLSADTASSSNVSVSNDAVDAESRSLIMKVQHLIERCLTFYLDEEDCAKELSKHAGIDPIITRTVWKELAKANPEFFEQYNEIKRRVKAQRMQRCEPGGKGTDAAYGNESRPR